MQVLFFCAFRSLQAWRSGRVWRLIPAQAATILHSELEKILHSAQNVAQEHFGRVWPLIPAQAASFFCSAPEKIPHSCAERQLQFLLFFSAEYITLSDV